MRQSSLSARLLVWILPVSLATTLAISLSTYLIARRVILWETQQGIAAVTEAAATEVKAYFEQRHNDLATLSQSPLFKDHYMNGEYGLSQEAEVYRREIEKMLLDLSGRAKAYLGCVISTLGPGGLRDRDASCIKAYCIRLLHRGQGPSPAAGSSRRRPSAGIPGRPLRRRCETRPDAFAASWSSPPASGRSTSRSADSTSESPVAAFCRRDSPARSMKTWLRSGAKG